MRRTIIAAFATLVLMSSVAVASMFKITIPDVLYPDGRSGTIEASVKTTKKQSVTVCVYFSDPYDEYLGQYQATDNQSTDAAVVAQYCLDHYLDRQ